MVVALVVEAAIAKEPQRANAWIGQLRHLYCVQLQLLKPFDHHEECRQAKLVEQRRDLVTDIGKTAKVRTKGNVIKLIALQSAIDALDKAYEDEKEDMAG